jgi:hydroxymethylbilane synthase
VRARSVRIGARSSNLSQSQVSIVSNLLKKSFGDLLVLEFVPVKTQGDLKPPPPRELRADHSGAKGAFTGDLEELLLKGEIDVAIHSMKDLTSELTRGLAIGATPPRSDPRDALISSGGETFDKLPRGARVGTSSLRRKAQLLGIRQDIDVVDIQGNVDTRIRKVLAKGEAGLDAIVLAVAGVERIGEGERISQTFSIDEMVPATGQGIIAVQIRKDDREAAELLARIDDAGTRLEADCERAFAQRLGADCNVPVGGFAKAEGGAMTLVGMLASQDCRHLTRKAMRGPSVDALSLGRRLAEELLDSEGLKGVAS